MPLPTNPPATTTPAALKTWAQAVVDTVTDHETRLDASPADLAAKANVADPTFTGEAIAPSFRATGKSGATATPIRLAGGTASGAPTTGGHLKGEIVFDDTGAGWYCTVAGTPGTWVAIGGGTLRVEDEGVSTVAAATALNFAGSGVTVTDAGSGEALVTIPGGSGSGWSLVAAPTVRDGTGDFSTSSATFGTITHAASADLIDYVTVTLAIGEIARCSLRGVMLNTSRAGIDFEVDQPTSANTRIAPNNDFGCGGARAPDPMEVVVVGEFIATEAGSHGFRPVWRCESGFGATFLNAASGTSDYRLSFCVEKHPVP